MKLAHEPNLNSVSKMEEREIATEWQRWMRMYYWPLNNNNMCTDLQCYHVSLSSALSRHQSDCHCPLTQCCQECMDTRSADDNRCSQLPQLDSTETSTQNCHSIHVRTANVLYKESAINPAKLLLLLLLLLRNYCHPHFNAGCPSESGLAGIHCSSSSTCSIREHLEINGIAF